MMPEHGEFHVEHEGEIVLLVAKGLWNAESSTTCIQLIADQVDQIESDRFALVADTTGVEGLTPDSVALWFEAIMSWSEKGHSAVARIDDPASISYKMFLKGFDEFFKKSIDFAYVNSLREGIDWAIGKGYQGHFKHIE